jgi:hypothetical protein
MPILHIFDRHRNTNLSKYNLGVVSSAENICKCTLVDLQHKYEAWCKDIYLWAEALEIEHNFNCTLPLSTSLKGILYFLLRKVEPVGDEGLYIHSSTADKI